MTCFMNISNLANQHCLNRNQLNRPMPYSISDLPRQRKNLREKLEFWFVTLPIVTLTAALIIISAAIMTIYQKVEQKFARLSNR